MTAILLKKNEDYDGASFELGLNGNMVHLWNKVKHYKNLISCDKKEPNFESLEDILRAIIGYAIIGLHVLSDETIKDKIYG